MSLVADYKRSLRQEDDQLLIEAGVMDDTGNITADGWELLKHLQFTQYKTQLVKAVEQMNRPKVAE